MKITLNDKINQFLNHCLANITSEIKNDFVGMHITKKNEKKVIKMLADAGIPEFQDSNNCPSLFLSVDEWENNPYHKNIHLDIYRNKFAIVPQETFLFGGTIKENISFGKNVSDEEIILAAKMANAYNFIQEDLPNKFETEVGERGALLSGGQKQRLAIARALIKNPEIMILDEATSALDSESEKLVQEALDSLMEGRTTFVIAHRLSTIVRADKIVVMENGEIKEMGTHSELIAMNGIYKNLYDIQFNENI